MAIKTTAEKTKIATNTPVDTAAVTTAQVDTAPTDALAKKTLGKATKKTSSNPSTTSKSARATRLTTARSTTARSTTDKPAVKNMMAKNAEAAADFNPTETPTGKYKPGKIRDRNLTNIINAAEEEFVHNGFRGASIQNIADRAGIPKANVHYYFKSKTNLYVAVLDNIITLWNDLLGEITVDDDPAVVLDLFIRKKVELSYTHPRASKLYAMEMIQGAPHLKGYIRTEMRQFVRRKAQIIEQWIELGRMDKVDPMHLIFLIWSSTQHYADFDVKILTVMNRAEYEPDMIKDISDFLSQMILKGCGLKPPTTSN